VPAAAVRLVAPRRAAALGPSRSGLSRSGLSRTGLSRTGLSRTGLSRTGLSCIGLSCIVALLALALAPAAQAGPTRTTASGSGSGPSASATPDAPVVTTFDLKETVTGADLDELVTQLRRSDVDLVLARIERPAVAANLLSQKNNIQAISDHRDHLAVVTPGYLGQSAPADGLAPGTLGNAGSLLFALARYRFGTAAESAAAFQDDKGLDPHLCNPACEKTLAGGNEHGGDGKSYLSFATAPDRLITDLALHAAGLAPAPAPATRSPSPTVTTAPGPGGGDSPVLKWLLVAIVVLALIVAAVGFQQAHSARADARLAHRGDGDGDGDGAHAGRAGSRPRPPVRGAGTTRQAGRSPRPAGPTPYGDDAFTSAPPAPISPPTVKISAYGVVGSPLRPTGYVRVDGGGLYRALWAGEPGTEPRVGTRVALAPDPRVGLLAQPVGAHGAHRAHRHD
jgi:hypothetical protein